MFREVMLYFEKIAQYPHEYPDNSWLELLSIDLCLEITILQMVVLFN